MSNPALLAVVDAVAWLKSALHGSAPAVDLCEVWSKLLPDDFEAVADDQRVSGSNVLRQLAGLEYLRRRGRILGWRFVASEKEGAIRVDIQTVGAPKMIVLRA